MAVKSSTRQLSSTTTSPSSSRSTTGTESVPVAASGVISGSNALPKKTPIATSNSPITIEVPVIVVTKGDKGDPGDSGGGGSLPLGGEFGGTAQDPVVQRITGADDGTLPILAPHIEIGDDQDFLVGGIVLHAVTTGASAQEIARLSFSGRNLVADVVVSTMTREDQSGFDWQQDTRIKVKRAESGTISASIVSTETNPSNDAETSGYVLTIAVSGADLILRLAGGTGTNRTSSIIQPQRIITTVDITAPVFPPPTHTSHSPTQVNPDGSTSVNIIGTGFRSGMTIQVDGGSFTALTVNSSTSATYVFPAHAEANGVAFVLKNTDNQIASSTIDYVTPVLFSPPQPSFLYSWLDPRDSGNVTAPGGVGTAAVDLSGHSHGLTAPSGYEFAYGAGHQINGLNAFGIEGNARMNITALGTGTNIATVAMAFELTDGSADNALFSFGVYAPMFEVHGGLLSIYYGAYYDSNLAVTNGSRHTAIMTLTTGGIANLFLDNVAASGNPFSINASASGLALAIGWDNSVSPFKGKIGTIFFYNGIVLGSTDRTTVHNELKSEWSTP